MLTCWHVLQSLLLTLYASTRHLLWWSLQTSPRFDAGYHHTLLLLLLLLLLCAAMTVVATIAADTAAVTAAGVAADASVF